jgi:type IV secretion system protein VirB6
VTYLNLVLDKATRVADNSAIVELGAQVCLAGVCAAILVYISAAGAALAGASATVSMQGLAAMGIGAAAFGAGKLAGGATKQTTRSIQDNIQGWKDASAGKSPHPEAVQVTTHRKRVNMRSSR